MPRTAAALVAILAFILASPGAVAWAGPSAAADDAAAHYKKGRSLYNVSEYRAALEEFKQAYVLHEDPAFLYNIAQCHRLLGNHREAITFYKRFINEVPRTPNRREIERLIGELEAKAAAEAPRPPPAAPVADHAVKPSDGSATPPPAAPEAPAPQPPPAPAATAETPAAAAASSATAGFHLELGLGGGGLHDDFTSLLLTNGTATGGSGSFQLAATYGVLPHLAVGVLLAAESVQSPRVETGGTRNDNVDTGALAFLGLAGDWRLRPGRTGWHFEGSVGAARMTIKSKNSVLPPRTPVGAGGIGAVGYDWALGQSWQLGALGRLLGCSLSDQGDKHNVVALSALLVISYR